MKETNESPLPTVLVVATATALILLLTLYPFDFSWRGASFRMWLNRWDLMPQSLFDFPRNVVLFMPLGAGVAALLAREEMRRGRVYGLTLLAGFVLTLMVESLQVYLPSRTPGVADVVANSLGAACGVVVFEIWRELRTTGPSLDRWLAPRTLFTAASGYFLCMIALVLVLMYAMRPGNWDLDYPLALGNELTGDRPWQGRLRDLVILDRAADSVEASLLLAGETSPALAAATLADYSLVGADGLTDRTGTLPDLAWRSEPAAAPDASVMLQLDDVSWLATGTTVAPLAERINASGQFTIAVTLVSDGSEQTGPARIATNSIGDYGRNWTLGQERDFLTLRFRTLYTSENATTPELQVRGVVTNVEPQRIVVSYDGVRLGVYSSESDRATIVALAPEIAFVGAFVGIFDSDVYWPVDVGGFPMLLARLALYSMIFLPVGALSAASVSRADYGKARARWAVTAVVLPALVLEFVVAVYGSFTPRIAAIALGIFLTFVAFATVNYGLGRNTQVSRRRSSR